MKQGFLIVFAFLSLPVLAQQADSLTIRRISNEILINGNAYPNLRYLTKQIGGRLTGSPNTYKAEQWGMATLKAMGADTVWLQQCTVPHWVREGKDEAYASVAGGKKTKLDVIGLGNANGTGSKGITAELIEIKSFDELEAKRDAIRGKIVFYNYKFNPTYIKTFEAYRDAGRYRSQGAGRAAKYGALAVLVRSMTHAADNHPHTGGMSYNDSFPKIPAAAVGLQDADALSNMLLKGLPVSLSLTTYGRMLPDTIAHNVIAEIRGSDFPQQIITIGGHLDSWDNCEGAHDDGAGCVQSMEVLRVFKALGIRPRRTIRIVLFANEENGLRGGNHYAAEAKRKGEQHYFALESDAGGFTPRGFSFSVSDAQWQKLQGWLPLFLPYGVHEFTKGGGGADIGPLGREFKTALAGLSPDSQRYFDIHHARSDVFESVNKRELELGAIVMAALVYVIDRHGLE